MKTKKIFKILILAFLLVIVSLSLISTNFVSAQSEENNFYDKYYYLEDKDIISRRLAKLENNNLIREFILNHDASNQFFYNLLTSEKKEVYQKILASLRAFDFNAFTGSITLLVDDASDETTIKEITKFLVRDYTSLFFVSPSELNVTKTGTTHQITLSSEITSPALLSQALTIYLENILLIKEQANIKPLDKDKAYVAFNSLCDLTFIKKKSKINLSYLGHTIFIKDKGTSELAYARALKHIYDLLLLDSFVELNISEKKSIGWVNLRVLDKYYQINLPDYLKESSNKYIFSFFLDRKSNSFAENQLSYTTDKISDTSFNKRFSYKNITINYDNKTDVYQNRFYKSRYPNSQLVEDSNFSDNLVYKEKLPFSSFTIKGKNNVKLNTTYTYLNSENNLITTKTAPTNDDFAGEVVMRSVIDPALSDTYFEVTAQYKVTDLLTVIFSKVQDGAPFGKKQTVDCFKGDFVKKVRPSQADGWINVGYTALSDDGLYKPITNPVEVEEDFRKPQHMTFVNGKGDQLSYGVMDYSSESLLKNTINVNSDLPHEFCFVGYKIKEVKDLTGAVIPNHSDKGKFIGTNKRRGEVPVTASYTLEQITDKIDIKLTGTAFKYIKKITNSELVPAGYDAAFRVHPKLKLFNLTNIKFKNNALVPKAYSLLDDLDVLDLSDKKQNINEFGVEVTAKGAHSFDERKIKVWIVVDHNIFLTWGWFKKWWWAVLFLLGLIVAIPFLIKPLIKLAKFIRRKKREKRVSQKEKEIALEKREEAVNKALDSENNTSDASEEDENQKTEETIGEN